MKCGLCGSVRKYKGLPPRKASTEKAPRAGETVAKKQSKDSPELLKSDFVSLKGMGRGKVPSVASTKLGSKKEKKKKESKSGLLDFLSTLND